MPKITSSQPEHGEANWSAKPGPLASLFSHPLLSDNELQFLGYLRRIVDAQERIALTLANISALLAERTAMPPLPAEQPSLPPKLP